MNILPIVKNKPAFFMLSLCDSLWKRCDLRGASAIRLGTISTVYSIAMGLAHLKLWMKDAIGASVHCTVIAFKKEIVRVTSHVQHYQV